MKSSENKIKREQQTGKYKIHEFNHRFNGLDLYWLN